MATTNLGDVMFAAIQKQADCMPFDRFDEDRWEFVHATGRAY